MEWVTDPEALKTLIRLRAIKVGDEVMLFYEGDVSPNITFIASSYDQPDYFIRWFEDDLCGGGWRFAAWRRP